MSRRHRGEYGGYRERSPSRSSRSYEGSRREHEPRRDRDEPRRGGYQDRDRGRRDYDRPRYDSPSTSSRSTTSEKLPDLPQRVDVPKAGKAITLFKNEPKGRVGRPIQVKVNYFPLQSLPVVPIYSYSLIFKVPPEFQRRGLAAASLQQQSRAMINASEILGKFFVYDGVSEGWSTDALLPVGTARSAVIDMEGGTKIEIEMRCSGALKIQTLVDYLATGVSGTPTSNQDLELCFKWLNALWREDPASRLITRPKSNAFFIRSSNLCLPLASTGNVLEALRGIHQSVAVGFGSLALNVDTCCAAFYAPDLPLLQVASTFAGLRGPDDLKHPDGMRKLVEDGMPRLVGMLFSVRHLGEAKKTKKFRVQGLSTRDASETKFDLNDPSTGSIRTISVLDYFHIRYETRLRYPNIPLLKTRAGDFPCELAYSVHGERYGLPLQGRETADFIKFATSPAFVRAAAITDNAKRLHWHTLDKPSAHGLSVRPQMLELNARILPAPSLRYGSGTEKSTITGAWNLRSKTFLRPSSYTSYGLCYFPDHGRHVPDLELQDFCKQLVQSCAAYGLRSPTGPPAFITGNPNGDIEAVIGGLLQKSKSAFGVNKPHIFFFLLHDTASPQLYKAIKTVCDVQLGIVSQCMLVEKGVRGKGRPQYLANICAKVNVKLAGGDGGVNCIIQDSFLAKKRVMHVGADVSHPSPSELKRPTPSPSFAALTASYDNDCCRYTAVAHAQEATKEMISALRAMFKELVKRYRQQRGNYPEVVLLWRDGLSESQITAFVKNEVAVFKEVRAELSASFTITAIVGIKRHHVRFFPHPQSERGDKLGNVLPGTIVEASSKPDDCNIFVVSASALQGTIVPCRYWKVYDEYKFTVDEISKFVMNSSFTYARATRSVSQVSSIYYAHQVAERARLHLQRGPEGQVVLPNVHEDLKYTMYWQ